MNKEKKYKDMKEFYANAPDDEIDLTNDMIYAIEDSEINESKFIYLFYGLLSDMVFDGLNHPPKDLKIKDILEIIERHPRFREHIEI